MYWTTTATLRCLLGNAEEMALATRKNPGLSVQNIDILSRGQEVIFYLGISTLFLIVPGSLFWCLKWE